jgi:hypothetical protein
MVKTAYVSRGEAGGHRRCRAASPPCRGGATSSAPTHSISSSSPPATTPWRQAAGIQDDAASFLPFRALLFGSGARLRELRREDEAAAPALLPLLDIVETDKNEAKKVGSCVRRQTPFIMYTQTRSHTSMHTDGCRPATSPKRESGTTVPSSGQWMAVMRKERRNHQGSGEGEAQSSRQRQRRRRGEIIDNPFLSLPSLSFLSLSPPSFFPPPSLLFVRGLGKCN